MSRLINCEAATQTHAKRTTLTVLLAALSITPPAAAEPRELTTAEILANVRSAVGYEELAGYEQDILMTGQGEQVGLEGEETLRFSPDGRFAATFSSRVDMRSAFDGRRGWIIDYRGLLRPLELEELELAQMQSWTISGHWLDENGPISVSRAPERDSERESALLLQRRDGCVRVHLHIDRTTWLPASMHRNSWIGPERWEFDDYREFAGFQIPTRVKYTSDIGNTQSAEFDTITAAPRTGADPFAPLKPPHRTARFDPDRPAEIEVQRSPVGWLLVHPMINGTDVGWFLFDTCGSALAITKTAADQLDMPSLGDGYGIGGGGPARFHFRPGKSLELGPVAIEKPVFVELELGLLTADPRMPVVGICGYDLFAQVVAEVDVTAPRIALYDPGKYKLPAGVWQRSHNPFGSLEIEAAFEGDHRALFRLDTGNPYTVIMHAPIVDDLRLLENRETRTATGTGVGGSDPLRVGTLDWFELAGHRFEDPSVMFATAKTAALATPCSAGTMGMQFMEPFLVVLDFSAQRIAFIPRADVPDRHTAADD